MPHPATGRNGSITRASHAAYEVLSATGSAADQSLLEYQIIFENAIVGICSMRNRILLRCNRRMEQIFGFGPGELDQQPVRILYPNKEAYERVDKVYANFPRHNQYVHEPQLVRKDGRLIWCIVSGRLLDPRDHAVGVGRIDDGPRDRGLLGGVAPDGRARPVGERVAQPHVDVAVRQHPLHRDARLASLVVSAHGASRRGVALRLDV